MSAVRRSNKAGLLPTLKGLLELVVAAVFLTDFVTQPFRIPSGSMEPTLRVGDFLLVDKQALAPADWLDRLLLPPVGVQRGEVVVFHFPADPKLHLVKRVVGLPGDRLRLRGGRVWINGAPLLEPYAFYSAAQPNAFRDEFPSLREADPNVDPRWWIQLRQSVAQGELLVPQESYFVLGDNRNDSEDSRYWGFVPRAALVGQPLVVYLATSDAEPGKSFGLRLRRKLKVHVVR